MRTIVIDSGSSVADDRFRMMGNIYYCGMLNESVRIMNEMNEDWIMFITSDVIIDEHNYSALIKSISDLDGIGSYSPSVTRESKSHHFCKNVSTSGLRDVNFNEGFMSLIRSDIINKICPIDTSLNKHGYGVDIYSGYICLNSGLRCVVDDSVQIYHPHGTGYNISEASEQMSMYVDSLNDHNFVEFLRSAL